MGLTIFHVVFPDILHIPFDCGGYPPGILLEILSIPQDKKHVYMNNVFLRSGAMWDYFIRECMLSLDNTNDGIKEHPLQLVSKLLYKTNSDT